MGFKGRKVGLIDERNEIAACSLGLPKNDIGIRTDVLDGCPKAEGIQIMIRSMSPDIIATDEIGRSDDAGAILDAINAGVKIITTIHGSNIEDFLRKPALEKLHKNLFERYIIMSRRQGVGTIEAVLDTNYKVMKSSFMKESYI
jgi:stage III sporulation protein AA